MSKVFISYSHDSDAHRQQVLALSDQLNNSGVDCDIDQYINGSPPEGWPLWMEQMLDEATHVLIICTETYLNRVKRKEKPGTGKGVKWESLLTYQDIYDNDSLNNKFIPVIFSPGSAVHIPKPLRSGSHYDLSHEDAYEKLLRYLTGQPLAIKPKPGPTPNLPPNNSKPQTTHIHSDRLPTVKGDFFGRETELELLNDAWREESKTHIIQFIAPGGTGKTKLLRHWLDHTDDIDALIAWSFYSQGASEEKQVSASPFFSHAFEKLGSTRTEFTTEEDRGEHLAELLRNHRSVLVLDGLEPLQHAGVGMRGELKDRASRQLLKSRAGHNNGLCIVTTRIAVHELADRPEPAVISQDLQNLAPEDGVKLLESLGVTGSKTELEKAVKEYGCHALALNLLGNVLRLRHQGDVQKRDTLKALVKAKGNKESRHAFKVMQTYEEWFKGEPELALLHLLGLFDHPIGQGVLQVLWDEQIPHLTKDIDEEAWLDAIAGLREEHHLLSQHDDSSDLDCHPLIREYFGRQLQEKHPDAWRQAHERLYQYYKELPEKELPDTLEEMQPLFSAVAHGCAAGLHQQVEDEVHWPRIKRQGEDYIFRQLGAFGDELAAISHYFDKPWQDVSANLNASDRAAALNWAGFGLRALGRLREALEPMQATVDYDVKNERWQYAAIAAGNLSELQLTLGDVAQAVENGQRSVDYADRYGDLFQRMSKRTTHADALHQAGEGEAARTLFREAEQLQQEDPQAYPRLYSLWGFRYCALLLAQGGTTEVLERADYSIEIAKQNRWLLDIALDQLTLGRAYTATGDLPQAAHWMEQAVAGLRAAGTQDQLPHGLLARAALHRQTGDFAHARQDLQEVFDIAEPSGMRLHLTDYHLEMARLLLAEENPDEARNHVAQAADLIKATGYNRRLPKLRELQQALN